MNKASLVVFVRCVGLNRRTLVTLRLLFFFGCNNSFCGCNISFFDCNISFCGYNISFCGYNISFCGCNNSKSDCYILFSACSKSKRDLCFSYATTYNLVDAFLSFKVLHETDAQRFVALRQA